MMLSAHRTRTAVLSALLWVVAPITGTAILGAQPPQEPQLQESPRQDTDTHPVHPLHEIDDAMLRLPLAAALGTALALRPRRRGTPPRQPAVVQTQIILAVVGAVIMLVVGASLARAFGIVGAANLIRYRSKIRKTQWLCCARSPSASHRASACTRSRRSRLASWWPPCG
jgi:hypothetical protein